MVCLGSSTDTIFVCSTLWKPDVFYVRCEKSFFNGFQLKKLCSLQVRNCADSNGSSQDKFCMPLYITYRSPEYLEQV